MGIIPIMNYTCKLSFNLGSSVVSVQLQLTAHGHNILILTVHTTFLYSCIKLGVSGEYCYSVSMIITDSNRRMQSRQRLPERS